MEIPDQYLERMRACFPNLTISNAYMGQDGLISDVFIVNDELVFRFPKDELGRQSLAKEARVLDLARDYVQLRIPHFEHQEDDLVVYRLIPGKALYRNDILSLDEVTQDQLAEQVATFLRQLHGIPKQELELYGISPFGGTRCFEDCVRFYQDIERELFPFLMTMAKDWVEHLFESILDGSVRLESEPALTHNDLAPYHFLYDKAGRRINGVIDFGSAGIGDPASDFALIINSYGENFLRRMAKYYPQIHDALDRARFYAGRLELEWALNGIRTGDLSWSVCHLGWARDVMPIRHSQA
jgi:aminoglycoside 2''-phosphotransferase